MLIDAGLHVMRSVPTDTWIGLATGLYKLHGGVVRDTAGRIVSHLAIPSAALSMVPGLNVLGEVVNAASVFALRADVKQLQGLVERALNLSLATTAVSGLGLVVSISSFAFLNHRLKAVESKLERIEKQTREIKAILNSAHRAQLLSAIDNLRQARSVTDPVLRHDLLMQGKQSFNTLAHHYKALRSEASDLIDLDATDEHFALAIMGAALCTSDLGMHETAPDDVRHHVQDWRSLARRHCGRTLLKDDPQRLLQPRYLKALPATELLAMLDFVNDSARGIGWIDDLREAQGRETFLSRPSTVVDDRVVAFAKKVRSKDEVLQGFVAHLGFLAERRLKASDFSSEIEQVLTHHGRSALWVSTQPEGAMASG